MWLGVDPLWEKYAGMNPYNYCAGNPVGLVDRDGRRYTEAFKEWADDMAKYAQKEMSKPDISECRKKEFIDSMSELQSLRDDKYTTYDVKYFRSDGNERENTISGRAYPAYTKYNKSNGNVEVWMNEYYEMINGNPLDLRGELGDFAHEAKHCYQFLVGELSFKPSNGGPGDLYDLTDEVAAHKRGGLFGGSSTVNIEMYPGLNNIYQSVISNTINYFDNHPINKDDVIQLGKINFEIFNYNGETVDFFIKKH